ncbi:hypothetical protein [Sandaracinus amylolyticus]|uniref:hypothetical protein n=1 Tax=Sandaracinus amylolyticus TaxID=927083 RepID=UPI001F40F275|nr:hypothetical protein [Sandaracinus amylolyticus]UJR86053.1 Hypothetical protein I5071_81340 [Sandaracinus amylolyticus]
MSQQATGSDPALKKLVNVMGEARASVLIEETLRRIGRASLDSPEARYRFGVELMKHGGVLESIGRSIKIQAILLGAKET